MSTHAAGSLYIGVTNGLIRRIEQHRDGTASAFTRKYRVYTLVWFQEFADVNEAIQRVGWVKGVHSADGMLGLSAPATQHSTRHERTAGSRAARTRCS